MRLYIGGVDRTQYVSVDSAEISRELSGKSTLRCVLLGWSGYRPVLGNELVLRDDQDTRIFAGNISRITERHAGTLSPLQTFEIEAWDFTRIPERRLVTADYQNLSLYVILNHIVTTFLANEGITLGTVESPTGVIDERLTFFYETAASVFNRLATITGYQWHIDYDKKLHFSSFASSPAPVSFTDTSGNWRDLVVERTDENYRNRQHERTAVAVADSAGSTSSGVQTEPPITAFAGQTIFPTKAVIHALIEITVNGSPRTFVGVNPLTGEQIPPSGYDFYYLIGGFGVFSLDFGPAGGGETIGIRYVPGWSPSSSWSSPYVAETPAGVRVITVDDEVEQAARRNAEGGSGIWEAIEEQRNISSVEALMAIAQGRLRQFGSSAVTITLETDAPGLAPGQRATVSVSAFGISGQYLIERCEYRWIATAEGDLLRTVVHMTTNEPYGMPIGYVEKLVEMARIGIADGGAEAAAGSGAAIEDWQCVFVDGSAPIAAASDAMDNHYRISIESTKAVSLIEWTAQLKFPGSIQIDILRSTNNGTSWQSILTSPGAINGRSGGGSGFSAGTLYRNDLLRLDILSADGSAGGLSVILRGKQVQI